MSLAIIWVVLFGLVLTGCSRADGDAARREMIERQLKDRGIADQEVLNAMASTRRENFVPEQEKSRAYTDGPLPIGHGQTISQPYIVALMTELLAPNPRQRVLEIGTGSGYQAAVMARLVRQVYSIEIVEPLALRAREALKKEGLTNVSLRIGDGYKGWPAEAPFDAIIVTCAPDHIPIPLVEQLREGGRMIIPVGREGTVQQLILLEKKAGTVQQTKVLDVRFVPMTRETN